MKSLLNGWEGWYAIKELFNPPQVRHPSNKQGFRV